MAANVASEAADATRERAQLTRQVTRHVAEMQAAQQKNEGAARRRSSFVAGLAGGARRSAAPSLLSALRTSDLRVITLPGPHVERESGAHDALEGASSQA